MAQVNGYVAGMELAAEKTRAVGTAAEQLAQKRASLEALGRPMLVFGALAAAATVIAIRKFAEFDEAMSNVNAVTQETTANMESLRDAALDAGGRTIFTATEAANAIEELGKAGLTTAYILDGALAGALSLAASGQLEVARAAEITAVTLKQFGLGGDQATHVADVLSAGAGKALGSVEDLAQALKFVGPVAASMGVSLEEATGALALFADQGIIGEQAGTSLRGVLASLTSPSAEASKEIDRLGISLYDSHDAFIGIEGVAGELSDAFKNGTDKSRDMSLGIIFGNQQVTAARVLFEQGADAVAKYTAEVNDAGYAARVAADRLDNLNGDLEKLSGAFDTALIKSGSGANEILRSIVQSITFLVDVVGDAPQPLLDAGLALGTVAAAVALAGGAALIATPKIVAFKLALKDTEISASTVALRAAAVGGAIGIATIAVSLFVARQAEAAATAQEFADSLDQSTGALTGYSRELVVKKLSEADAFRAAKEAGISQQELTDAVVKGGDALAAVQAKLTGNNTIASFFQGFDGTAGTVGTRAGNASDAVNQLAEALDNGEQSWRDADAVTQTASEAYSEAADEAAALQSNLTSLIDTINKANGVGQDAITANIDYQDSLAKINEQIANVRAGTEGYAAGLNLATDAGRDNYGMLVDVAKGGQDAAQAQFNLDGNVQNYIANLQTSRDAVLQNAEDLGATAGELQNISDTVVAMPTQHEIDILVDTHNAQYQLDNFIYSNDGRQILVSVNAEHGFAGGGYTGSGSKFQPAGVVHAGEFVSTAETVRSPANRAALEYMHAGGEISGYAAGGYVPSPASSSFGSSVLTALTDPALLRLLRDAVMRPVDVSVDGYVLATANQSGNAKLAAIGAS